MAERRFLTNIDREALEQAIAEKVDATAVNTAVANLVDSAPDTLNTLNELAAALGDDPNFATTMATELGKKSTATNLVNGSSTGSLRVVGAKAEDSTYKLGQNAFAEGKNTVASGTSSHAEGRNTTASDGSAHAEGRGTTASGGSSHAEGANTIASGQQSHAEGYGAIASSKYQHAQGKYNIIDEEDTYAHIVGNGESEDARSNAHTLDWSGNGWFAGDVYVGSTSGTNKDDGSKKLATEEFVNAASESFVQTSVANLVDNVVPAMISGKLNESGWSPNSVLTTDGQGNVVATKIGEEGSPFEEQLLYSGSFPNLIGSVHNEVVLNFNLTAGASYSVYVNGTKYSVICEYRPMNAMLALGNKHIIQEAEADTGEPFFIYEKTGTTNAGKQYIIVGASGNYEISIYTLVPTSGSTSGSGGASLAGKKILMLGDSVNAGNGWEGGFANLINEEFEGVTVNNSSNPGAKLIGKEIYGQLQVTFQSGFIPDYIIFDGGGNDILTGVAEGSVDIDTYSAGGYGDEFDISTIAGAFENLVTNMQKFMPNAKIIFFNLYKMHPTATSITYTKQRQVWNLLRECCEKYSIRYVDLWGEGNFTPNSTEQWNAFMYDWVHINEAGYRRLWPLIKHALLVEANAM